MGSGWYELLADAEDYSNTPIKELISCDPSNFTPVSNSEFNSNFQSLNSLVGNANNADYFLPSTANSIIESLEKVDFFNGNDEQWKMEVTERKMLIVRYVKKLVPIFRSNPFGLLDLDTITNEEELTSLSDQLPAALFCVASLVNHACQRNVFQVCVGGAQIEIRAIRDIQEGEELLTSYGAYSGLDEPRQFRLDWLQYHFRFECQCHACASPQLVALEREMVSFKCSVCKLPVAPIGAFDEESPLNMFSAKLKTPMSTLGWVNYHVEEETFDKLTMKCSCGVDTVLEKNQLKNLAELYKINKDASTTDKVRSGLDFAKSYLSNNNRDVHRLEECLSEMSKISNDELLQSLESIRNYLTTIVGGQSVEMARELRRQASFHWNGLIIKIFRHVSSMCVEYSTNTQNSATPPWRPTCNAMDFAAPDITSDWPSGWLKKNYKTILPNLFQLWMNDHTFCTVEYD